MFTKITPTTDSSLSKSDIANLAIADAIAQVKLLTGLSEQASIKLLTSQLNANSPSVNLFSAPILERSESLYIAQLFN